MRLVAAIDFVQAMVNIVDHLLVFKFGKRLGFADPSVTILDPATGTGTFPLAVIDAAANITKGLANILAAQLDLAIVPPAEDIAAYV